MISKFLNAKHWQLFMLQFGIPFLLQIVFMATIFSTRSIPFSNGLTFSVIIIVITLLYTFLFFGWFWSIAVGLNKLIPDDLKLNVGRFKIFLLIPAVYLVIFSFSFAGAFMGAYVQIDSITGFIGIIFPLHLFSMFCIFYCMYFVAKTIKTAEVKKSVSFSDFAGEFFMIWFYPIGIWILQPRVNKLVNSESESDSEILDSDLQ